MTQWLAGQIREAVAVTRGLQAHGVRVFLHYKRGSVVASPAGQLDGYELVTALPVPTGKSQSALLDWVTREVRQVPCCP